MTERCLASLISLTNLYVAVNINSIVKICLRIRYVYIYLNELDVNQPMAFNRLLITRDLGKMY